MSTVASLDRTRFEVFPTSPKVSSEGREFLRKLLTRDREHRPDALEALREPYIRKSWSEPSARARNGRNGQVSPLQST